MSATNIMTREVPLIAEQSALLIIDVQNYSANRDGGGFKFESDETGKSQYEYYFRRLEDVVVPNMQKLLHSFRDAGIEVLYTTIESLTDDCRDFSLDYKISGFSVPKGSWDGKVIDQIAPRVDEIVFPKSSSSVFVSTNIDYVLRNLGIRQLAVCGLLTDQCVESAVRDACDLGYLVTLVTDACATLSELRHDNSLNAIKGYCRQVDTAGMISEIVRKI